MPFGSSAPTYTPKTTQRLLAEFWIQVNWPPYLPDLNMLDFYIWSVLQEKVQAMPQANLAALCPSSTMEWYISAKPATHSAAVAWRLLWRKMVPSLNIWLANSPALTSQYFSGLT
jgi:hypothetical protein